MPDPLIAAIDAHLHALVDGHPDRHVGGPGNEHATACIEKELRRLGWEVTDATFQAVDWQHGQARLSIDGHDHPVLAGPYTPAVDAQASLLAIDSVERLEAADLAGRIILLHGRIAADQLFPKSFTFLDVPEHRRIYSLLETGRPAAVISATGRGSGLAGGLYPYPLIEDGDFLIPNAYTTDETGEALLAYEGRLVRLTIGSHRFPVTARQLTARRGPTDAPRVVIIAHIDSKEGSPGAVDNATGAVALLAIAALLADEESPHRLEIVPMNGEDHYSAGGEHLFVAENEGRWGEVSLAINLDAVGARDAGTAVSLYGCPDDLAALVERVMARHPETSMGEAWYESDHSIVAMAGRPAMALTSTTFRELCASVTHTERDTLEVVSAEPVAAAARLVADVVRSLAADRGAAPR